jgi:hypothetical protein
MLMLFHSFGMTGPAEVQRVVMGRIADHLSTCSGSGVVVIDEVQKFVPGSVEVFMSGIKHKPNGQ